MVQTACLTNGSGRWMRGGALVLGALMVVGLGSCGDDTNPATEPIPCELDCDDDSACTLDFCIDGACTYENVAEGTDCDGDEDQCNGTAVCDAAGACVFTPGPELDNSDSCVLESCDPDSGEVKRQDNPGCLDWKTMSTVGAPTARWRHTAVWTGEEMIVWGGLIDEAPGVTNSGARYDPVLDTWEPISTSGAPSARHSHSAVWTGQEMLIWGGFGAADFESDGARYNPSTDQWTPMSTAGAPAGRTGHSTVWTGTEMIIWGGAEANVLASGGAYQPSNNTWSSLDGVGPSGRFRHGAVWTGDRMLVWGGNNLVDWDGNGKWLDDSLSWSGDIASGGPSPREQHSAIWTGTEMIVWGGFNGGAYEETGGALIPTDGGGAWRTLSTSNVPAARVDHISLWLGDAMFVWGGCGTDSCAALYADGGIWLPDVAGDEAGTWASVIVHPNLGSRRVPAAVWTGSEIVVWGGMGAAGLLATGARATYAGFGE